MSELKPAQLHQLYIRSLILGRKREQPIFSTKAHVFHIDPKTKTSWVPASSQAVTVSFFYDSTRSLYRIISVEGTKAVINSTITPSMLFTKTSQKFGQWSDVRANTVYGLGFASEGDLNKFIEQFKEVKEATRLVAQKAQANGSVCQSSASNALPSASSLNHDEGRENNSSLSNQSSVHQRSHSLTSLQTPGESPQIKPKSPKSPTLSVSSSTSLPSNSVETQLRYENEKLKIALAQSSANAKKWEIELQTLKSNNSRLTTALQESTANVEEWKKQLQAYKEECAQLKKKVLELKAGQEGSGDDLEDLQKEISELKNHIEAIEGENKRKDQEVGELNQRITELTVTDNTTEGSDGRHQDLQAENTTLRKKVGSLQEQLNSTLRTNQAHKKRVLELQTLLGIKLKEVANIQDQILAKMQS